ncbi:heavy-metal-associated domain-containing protein [Mycobacterium sp. AT1]|uniref:heavy-metal-associated domain-containing protein n=1 Tax=Mycobacterium sp. AT1 TaxID=1961706 RepID=UPI0009D13869|nr:heavy metal-associated domain-containing protein [Mycobacterium sp. AT1]OPX13041.1 hypothetical protein B1790_01360 [Mycobacterium sp. AT1]
MVQTFSVDGLHCQGCADTVSSAISGLAEVRSVRVVLDTTGSSTVEIDAAEQVTVAQVQSALDAEGNFAVLDN